jgi:predicted helicase
VKYLTATYNETKPKPKTFTDAIKWSRNLKRRLSQERREPFSEKRMTLANYRPYSKRWLYKSDLFVDELGHADQLFPKNQSNPTICFTDPHAQKPWFVCAVDGVTDLHYVGAGAGTVCLGRYRFVHGDQIDNITNWTLDQFRSHYKDAAITKDAIFYYVYGVCHDPIYREKYALNLKREYPRIPLYSDFRRWAGWGERLMRLHLDYEAVDPWPLERIDIKDQASRHAGLAPKAVLRANKEEGIILLNGETQLLGVPSEAWNYRLGIRSALEWVLDQYGESTPRDDMIREKFSTYSFADHKERVIDLLGRVTRVSIETQRVIDQMRRLNAR